MITLRALTSWFNERQTIILASFVAGVFVAFLFAKLKLNKTFAEIFDSIFTVEGSTIVLVSTVLFFYLSLQEDEIDSKRVEFLERIEKTLPACEVLTENTKPTHYEKVENVLIDMLKNKLNEEIKYSEIKPK